MNILMGPVLGFRGNDNSQWKVCALTVVNSTAANLTLKWKVGSKSTSVQGTALKVHEGSTVWLHEWSVPQSARARRVIYSFDATEFWKFSVPPNNNQIRMAYASCNGFSSVAVMKQVEDKNDRWKDLSSAHNRKPYHLLLMGGDQVYADSLWEVVDEIKEWVHKLKRFRLKKPFTQSMRTKVEAFYFKLYCERWSDEEVRKVMASIPTLMMWDDHDIFDGWGSYDDKMQTCPVYQGIFQQAREHFKLFQLKTKTQPAGSLHSKNGFTYAFKVGDVGVAALDLRSERTETQVMSEDSWARFYTWLDGLTDCKHLFLMSSIPVVYPGFSTLETILGILPGRQSLEDDLRDHWTSRPHRAERLRLIHRLMHFSGARKCRVTILAGDVHVGALGQIDSDLYSQGSGVDVVHQLISSGIAHPPPPAIALCFLKNAGDKIEQVDTGITAQMTEFPGSNVRFINARNWLSLTVDEQGRVWAEWFAEGEAAPYTKVVLKH